MPDQHERHVTRPRGRLLLAFAAVLTVTMFGWQGYHLYSAYEAGSRRHTATLVEELHSAGEAQLALVEDLEHEVLVSGNDLTRPDVTDWATRYAAASAGTQAAAAAALSGIGDRLVEPTDLIDSTRRDLDLLVERILPVLAGGGSDETAAVLSDPQYLTAQAEFTRAVDSQIVDLALEMEARTTAERIDELHSVGIALVLFTTAIGAWAIFARNLRRNRVRLADEQERRRAAEAEASQMQKIESLGMMADGVAHDVKNLTVVILGSIDEVRKGLPEEHRASVALNRIEEATRQADDVATALLAFSRKAEPPSGAVDLASLAVGMTQLLRYILPPPIELTVEAPTEAWVRGDAVQLQQAILNLAVNARDAMPLGGSATITVQRATRDEADGDAEDNPEWLLVIDDTGEGMTPDVVDRMFEPFFTTRASDDGSGLGLAIVDRVVRDHGGWIDVSTCPGVGSTFTIGLPAQPAPTAPPVDEPGAGGSLVLVAHPVRFVRELICGALASEGCRTRCVSTVEEVGDCFAGGLPSVDLAVIEAELLQSADLPVPPTVPVIVTGEAATEVDLGGRADVIAAEEPLSLEALTESVAGMLQRAPVAS